MENDITRLLENKKFVEKIFAMKTPEEIQKAFSDKGGKNLNIRTWGNR